MPQAFHNQIHTMDNFRIYLQIVLFLVTIMIFNYFKTSKPNIQKNPRTTAPEPPGAWPIIGHLHLLDGQTPVALTLGAMADKYGPIFSLRLGTHHGLVVSNWEAIKECFTTNDRIFADRPNMAMAKYIGYNRAGFAMARYGPYWRDVRKIVTTQLFTARRLSHMSHVRASEVDHFIRGLYSSTVKSSSDAPTKVVTMSSWFEYVTINTTIRMMVRKRFSIFNDGVDKDWEFKEAVKKALYLSGVFVWSDAIPSLEWLDIGGYIKQMKHTSMEMDRVLEDWLQERIRTRKQNSSKIDDEEGEDFMDVLLSVIPENEMVSGYNRDTVIKATILILILTGSESMAITLIWTLSLLLNNPQTVKRAQDELENHVGHGRWVQESDMDNLTYLQAILKETLRLYPPGPLAGPHEATQDCYVQNYHVPKGTRLIVNLWKLHRDPAVWSDPNEFRPERFLNENSDMNYRGQCFEYIPFSSGRRMCPASMYGLQVIELTLARLLQGFDLSTPMGEAVDMEEGLGIALPKLKPLQVILTPRLPIELYQNLDADFSL